MPETSHITAERHVAGPLLFTFAIVTDTHIRPPEGDQSSPFPVNELANARARHAVAAIARHAPDFTIHLGDMVHPVPNLPSYGPAADEALSILEPLAEGLRFVPGNHDVGDKPMPATPAAPVDRHSVDIYEKYFGPGHYSFDHGGVHFVVVNSSLVNAGNAYEESQRQWLEKDLAENGAKRTLLFSHYPPFIDNTSEPSHYDNYGEPGRAWLLALLARHDVEAVFSGHVHQFFYNRVAGMKLYCLPPTSFTRQDYSELYGIGPAPEYGRNDEGKFSYAMIDVFERGHALRVYPTEGRGLEAGAAIEPEPVSNSGAVNPVTVHLRHGWARSMDMPYNGPMEEFSRKRARNDYSLLRLWQMGITRVRTPLCDLASGQYGPRVQDFHAAGCSFTFFCAGVAERAAWEECCRNTHLIDAVEFVTCRADLSDIGDALAGFEPGQGPEIHLGKFHSSADEPKHGSTFAHSVSFGFKWEDRDVLLPALKKADPKGVIKALVFQVNMEDDLAGRLGEIDQFVKDNGLKGVANIRFANVNPAIANFDDRAIAARVGEAADIAPALERTSLQFDTFADIDRGYHPRHGLLDGRYNFRPAGRVLMARFGPAAP